MLDSILSVVGRCEPHSAHQQHEPSEKVNEIIYKRGGATAYEVELVNPVNIPLLFDHWEW